MARRATGLRMRILESWYFGIGCEHIHTSELSLRVSVSTIMYSGSLQSSDACQRGLHTLATD